MSNYDGTVDKTGQKKITMEMGSKANGGAFGFAPPAIKVDLSPIAFAGFLQTRDREHLK